MSVGVAVIGLSFTTAASSAMIVRHSSLPTKLRPSVLVKADLTCPPPSIRKIRRAPAPARGTDELPVEITLAEDFADFSALARIEESLDVGRRIHGRPGVVGHDVRTHRIHVQESTEREMHLCDLLRGHNLGLVWAPVANRRVKSTTGTQASCSECRRLSESVVRSALSWFGATRSSRRARRLPVVRYLKRALQPESPLPSLSLCAKRTR